MSSLQETSWPWCRWCLAITCRSCDPRSGPSLRKTNQNHGDYTSHFFLGIVVNHFFRIPIKQPGFNGKYDSFFFSNARMPIQFYHLSNWRFGNHQNPAFLLRCSDPSHAPRSGGLLMYLDLRSVVNTVLHQLKTPLVEVQTLPDSHCL